MTAALCSSTDMLRGGIPGDTGPDSGAVIDKTFQVAVRTRPISSQERQWANERQQHGAVRWEQQKVSEMADVASCLKYLDFSCLQALSADWVANMPSSTLMWIFGFYSPFFGRMCVFIHLIWTNVCRESVVRTQDEMVLVLDPHAVNGHYYLNLLEHYISPVNAIRN